jgi:hypothetical protein
MNVLFGAKKTVKRKPAKSLKELFTTHLQKMRVEAKKFLDNHCFDDSHI